MKNDLFDNRYNVYLYGFKDKDINDIMDNGINIIGYSINKNLKRVYVDCDNDDMLLTKLDKYLRENNFSFGCVLRIPSYYMGWVHRNGVKESFVPILKHNDSIKMNFLIPDLIYLFYDVCNKKIYYNDKYNAMFDPCGLQYTEEQIMKMYTYGCYDLHKMAFDRRKYNYDYLKKFDIDYCFWEKTMKYYKSSKLKKLILSINKNSKGKR